MNTDKQVVGDVMTRELVTLGRNERLLVADDVMKLGRIRHLPIVDEDGKLAGIVSQRDLFHSGLLRALGYGSHARATGARLAGRERGHETDVITTTPDTSIKDAAKLMLEKKIGCLLVLEGDRLVGILTESDFVKLAVY